MQLVSAFSRPQTVLAVPRQAPKKTLWILSSWRDLILYVGTPLLILPIFGLAQMRWSAQDIYLFVAAFGAMGHHLPGMIRAYGDRALFERFKWRFILAPVFLLAVCVSFTLWELQGIVLIVFFWGVWHGMMQTYGFCRIYDAKVGSFAALTRRLDFITCASWFAAAVLLSSSRMTDTLRTYYASGGPYLAPHYLRGAQQAILFVAITVSILFLANFIRSWVQGKRPNPVKLALLGSSIGFWWFCNNGVTNILAGIALFEVFHDTQYLSLVWIYNRNRVEKDRTIGGFTRFVFRRSGSLVGLYIGLVFAYGAFGYFGTQVNVDVIKRILTGVVAASGLLHFYYDGFIWKVREASTRESLGLSGGTAAAAAVENVVPPWFRHGLKWVAIFVLPLSALWIGQSLHRVPTLQGAQWVVDDLPAASLARFDYGAHLRESGRLEEAVQQLRAGLGISPDDEQGHYTLASLLLQQSKPEEAAYHLERALARSPQNADMHSDYGYVLELRGQKEDALAQYRMALRLSPKSPLAHYNCGMFLFRERKPDEARAEFEHALQIKPDYADADYALGNLLFEQGDFERAKLHYLEAKRITPRRGAVHNMLGIVFMREKKTSQAILEFAEAVRLQPDDPYAADNLRRAQAINARFGLSGIRPR